MSEGTTIGHGCNVPVDTPPGQRFWTCPECGWGWMVGPWPAPGSAETIETHEQWERIQAWVKKVTG